MVDVNSDDTREFLKKIGLAKHLLINDFYLKNFGIKIQSSDARENLFDFLALALEGDSVFLAYLWSKAEW